MGKKVWEARSIHEKLPSIHDVAPKSKSGKAKRKKVPSLLDMAPKMGKLPSLGDIAPKK